jgi:putative endonuclease
MKTFYVYIMASYSRTLYTGVTGNLARRMFEHKHKTLSGFTNHYNITRLVYYEEYSSSSAAILREKAIKGMSRAKKFTLINAMNPEWEDLAKDWFIDR